MINDSDSLLFCLFDLIYIFFSILAEIAASVQNRFFFFQSFKFS